MAWVLVCYSHPLTIDFRDFVDKPILQPAEITESFCKRFRQFLLDKFNGETPMNYFGRFKRVVKAATKDGESWFMILPSMKQLIIKGFGMFIYDFKYDDLSQPAYN